MTMSYRPTFIRPQQGPHPAACAGQGTTEFAVFAIAGVVLFAAVAALGQRLETMQATERASRFVAFEQTVQSSHGTARPIDEIGADVRTRFFARDPFADGASATGRWSDFAGRPSLPSLDNAVSASVTSQPAAFVSAVSRWSHDGFGLPERTFVTAEVAAHTRGDRAIAGLDLTMRRRTAILTDNWAATSPAHARSRVEAAAGFVVPMNALAPAATLVGHVPPTLTDPRWRPGLQTWDVVPCDRFAEGC